MTTPPPLAVGQRTSTTHVVDDALVRAFADVSGDHNPVHLDDAYAATTVFGRRIAHGMIVGSFISAVLANELEPKKSYGVPREEPPREWPDLARDARRPLMR